MKKCEVCGNEFPEWFIYEAVRNDLLIQTCYVCGNNYQPFTVDSFIQKLDHQQLWQAYQARMNLVCRALKVLRDLDLELRRLIHGDS